MSCPLSEILALPNVTLHPSIKIDPDLMSDYSVATKVAPLVKRLSREKPLWSIQVCKSQYSRTFESFNVFNEGEHLGSIGQVYKPRGYVFTVSNDRISAKLSRGTAYATDNIDRAMLKIKQTFAPRNKKEMLEAAVKQTANVLNNASNMKQREYRSFKQQVKQQAEQFIMEEGFHLFLAHVEAKPEKYPKVEHQLAEAERTSTEMLTIDKVLTQFNGSKTALVVKADGSYLVKIGDNLGTYDDNTLPADMRGKLGMLKLVDAEVFLTDIGCRINDEVFVLLMEEN